MATAAAAQNVGASGDTTGSYTLAPKYEGTVTGNIRFVRMNNEFKSTLKMANGYIANGRLAASETHYRLQDRFSNERNLLVNLVAPLRVGLSGLVFNTSITENKTFDRVVTVGNQAQELVNNPRRLRAGLAHNKFYPTGVTLNWKVSSALEKVPQTFQTDYNMGGTANGAIKIGQREIPFTDWMPMVSEWKVAIEGRGFYNTRYTETEDDTRDTREEDLGGESDSLKAMIRLHMDGANTLEGRYERFIRSDERMTFPRGVLGNQQFGAELIREAEFQNTRMASLDGRMQPMPGLSFGLRMEHRNDLNDFREQQQLFRHTVADRVAGNISMTFFGRIRFRTTMDWSNTDTDLGPLSVSSLADERRQLRLNADWLDGEGEARLQTAAGISLLQTTYTDVDDLGRQINPRDRDQQDTYVNARLLSNPLPKMHTNIYASITRAEYVSISSQFSQNNRSQVTYDFRPELTYELSDRITIKQTYGLNLEFTDQFFERPGTEDLLDRNVTFKNDVSVRLTSKIRGSMVYTLLLHSRGSFLPEDPDVDDVNARFFDIENEDRRDQMELDVEYDLNRHLTIVAGNRYSRRTDIFVGTERQNVFEDGALELGARGSYRWGDDRSLVFRLIRVKQFGRFTRPEQEDFWQMNTDLVYAF